MRADHIAIEEGKGGIPPRSTDQEAIQKGSIARGTLKLNEDLEKDFSGEAVDGSHGGTKGGAGIRRGGGARAVRRTNE
ncbi:hypothetical protein LOZ03_000949 [Ophidiomyces ophidiicola]|nr:hypothetical protein LOZ03_000949 [Ophidiomyces ophidiicola]